MESCDVLVAGGGPAGSTCARELTRAGLDVVVLDKHAFPRDKVCAGWVTPEVLDQLGVDTADYADGRVLQPIHAFRTRRIGGAEVETRYEVPISYGILRCEFDDYLLRRSGGRLRLGEALKSLQRRDGFWIANDRLRARMLVGAGGHFCPVARHLGAELGATEQIVAAQEIEFQMTPEQAAACPVAPDTPELAFCDDLKGYGWCFRKGDYLNVGLGRQDNHQLAERVKGFARELAEAGRIPDPPGRFKGHAYLLYRHAPRRVAGDGALLIGDAAGLAYTQSGEGIRTAVESARMAAEVILAAGGDYREARLQPYLQRLTSAYGRRDGVGLADLLPAPFKRALARRLLASRWFSRHVLLDRWFLHAR